MLVASTRKLKTLAALVWYAGGIVLLLKGSSLLVEAEALRPEQNWPWLAVVAGLFLGGLQAKLLFSETCQKNLDRIAALELPKAWQFFRPGFFVMLTVMILAGATLSRLAHNNYPFLIGVGTLDLSLATALLGSSYVFWTHKASGSISVSWFFVAGGVTAKPATDLITWLREWMAHYKVSKSVVFVDALPETGANKVDKAKLIEQYGVWSAGGLVGRRLPNVAT